MLRELVSIFRSHDKPLGSMGESFRLMLQTALDNTLAASGIFFSPDPPQPEARTAICDKDIEINKAERGIRKQVAAHLSLDGTANDVPYCLLLMSLVKDVERIGDYAKNLSELRELKRSPLPDDSIVAELAEIRREVEATFKASIEIFGSSDHERALSLIHASRAAAQRCDRLINRTTQSTYDAATTTAVVLGIRYYKRIGGHVLNILSSTVMPLHKIDYYDEDELDETNPGREK